jgi:hypothetical protein
MTQNDEHDYADRMAWAEDEIEMDETGSDEGGITAQMGLADAEGIIGQLIDLARSPSWVNEKRDSQGQWARGGNAARRATISGGTAHGMTAVTMRQAQANRQSAQAAVAERIAEDKARKALDVARRELEAARKELEDNERTKENAKHRAKLASHALLVLGGALLAAILAHFDVSPVLAGLSTAMPLLATELTDWKKKL